MIYLELSEVLELHRLLVERTGGSSGVRDLGLLQSALAQPRMTFAGEELYPTLPDKADALTFSLIRNHPFLDGNKRTAFVSAVVFLEINGLIFHAPEAEVVAMVEGLASRETSEPAFAEWLRRSARKKRARRDI